MSKFESKPPKKLDPKWLPYWKETDLLITEGDGYLSQNKEYMLSEQHIPIEIFCFPSKDLAIEFLEDVGGTLINIDSQEDIPNDAKAVGIACELKNPTWE